MRIRIISFILLLHTGSCLFADLTGWTEDIRLTYHGHSQVPVFVEDINGLHLAWSDYRYETGNSEVYYQKSTDKGRNWHTEKRLTDASGYSSVGNLITDLNGLHIVWTDERDAAGSNDEEIYYKKSTDGGETWSDDKRLTIANGESRKPDIVSNSDGLHVVWCDKRDGNIGSEIYYKRSTDGGETWTSDTRLTNDSAGSASLCIVSDENGLHLFWSSGYIFYKRSVDGGDTWTSAIELNREAFSNYPKAISDSNGLHLIWTAYLHIMDRKVLYTKSTDGGDTWTTPVKLTENNDSWADDITSDTTGLHAVYRSWPGSGAYEIYYRKSNDGGNTWEDEVRLTNASGWSHAAEIVVSNNVIHMVWSDWRNGDAYIYYKRYDPTPPSGKPSITSPIGNISYKQNVTLRWSSGTLVDNESLITGWHLQVGTTQGGSDIFDAELGDFTFYTIENLENNRTYYARVRAKTEVGYYSEWSDVKVVNTNVSLNNVITYPNPFRVNGATVLTFKNFTQGSQIRIYTLTGELVKKLNDTGIDGIETWDGRNISGKQTASGTYFYIIKDSQGNRKTGKLAMIK